MNVHVKHSDPDPYQNGSPLILSVCGLVGLDGLFGLAGLLTGNDGTLGRSLANVLESPFDIHQNGSLFCPRGGIRPPPYLKQDIPATHTTSRSNPEIGICMACWKTNSNRTVKRPGCHPRTRYIPFVVSGGDGTVW